MSGIILNTTENGLRLIIDSFEIIIDPTKEFSDSSDAFLISNIHNLNSSLCKHKLPVFVPENIKELTLHTSLEEEFIIGCTLEEKHTLRKHRKKILDFSFIEFKSHSGSSLIILERDNNIIVYATGALPAPELIPPCDTLIINAGKQTPLTSLMNTIPEFTVEISDFSRFLEVISSFNLYAPDDTVGIDHTALEAACLYLKNNYTVFSKAIKPLSQYEKLPPVIITADTSRYPLRPVIPDVLFSPHVSLREIYTVSSAVKANNVIAYCPDYVGERKRGKLTITGNDTIFQI